MSALENDRNPFQGKFHFDLENEEQTVFFFSHPDYSDMVELVPDHPMDKEVRQ